MTMKRQDMISTLEDITSYSYEYLQSLNTADLTKLYNKKAGVNEKQVRKQKGRSRQHKI